MTHNAVHRNNIKKIVIIIVAVIGLGIVGATSFVVYKQQTEIAQIALRLNGAYEKMNSVNSRLSQFPNVTNNKLTKTCERPGGLLGSLSPGPKQCSVTLSMIFDHLDSYDNVAALRQKVVDVVGAVFRYDNQEPLSKMSDNVNVNYYGDGVSVSSGDLSCSQYDSYYPSSSNYNGRHNLAPNYQIEFLKGGYVFSLNCTERVPDYIKGYTIKN